MWSYLISWCRISVTVFVRNVCQCRKRWQKPHTINLVFLHQPVESVTFHFLPLQYHSGCFTSDLVCDVLSWAYLPRCVFCVTLPRWHCRFAIMSSISQLQNSNKSFTAYCLTMVSWHSHLLDIHVTQTTSVLENVWPIHAMKYAASHMTTHATSGVCRASVELARKARSLPYWMVLL